MRIYIHTTPSSETLPFNNQELLLGVLHKWLGKNNVHDETSLYSFSWLQGGNPVSGGLRFPAGAEWFISMYDKKLLEQCVNGLKVSPEMFQGLVVSEVQIRETPVFGSRQTFYLASPVLIKHWDGQDLKHLTWEDKNADEVMTKTLSTKLDKTGVKAKATVRFDCSYARPKTKLIKINTIYNRCNFCPVIIEGDPEALAFAWDVGVGHSTGSGFGAVK